jgi:hypothetical protein
VRAFPRYKQLIAELRDEARRITADIAKQPKLLNVQGWITRDPTEQADTYEPVTCTACARTHWVNPKTRKVLDKK